MAEQPDLRPQRRAVRAEIVAEHRRLATSEREQAGAEPEEGRLARTVRAAQQDDLTAPHVQRRTGQSREPPEHRDGVLEVHDGLHGVGRRYRKTPRADQRVTPICS